MQDGDPALGPAIGQEIARHAALLVVTAAEAEDVAAPFLGEPRVGGGRSHHHHARRLVDRGRHQGGMRAQVADDEAGAGVDQLLRRRHRLVDAADVVRGHDLDRAPEDAALAVEVLDRKLDRRPVAAARCGEGAGERVGETDQRLGGVGPARGERGQGGDEEAERATHGFPLPSACCAGIPSDRA